ncbi:glycine--tRNA ligase subunit beta [Alkalicoccus halolimnae]|uniref:Glycine--tRNA ligase beta subunit n=1 Tax=Alkalicoccus halolimnae TaxID=1667239 RepID=A0A5C7FNX2_9BACI|nr:glycine--tRNA ligase subunit beta [Alkalicoccus halolimnae]TXF86435.1 glycine--tRNA ligase subunit beta [Alkalicoccus halolimnae]
MNKRTLLLEIGLEEMPARFVTNAMNELAEKIGRWMKDHRVEFEEITRFSTPRRLAVQITGINEQQTDVAEEAKGPSEKIAVKDNEWTKAALGFARGQGVSVDKLYIKELKGENYVYAKKFVQGEPVITLLPQLKEVMLQLTFPKNMRWGAYDIKYVRPVKWITALFGSEIIPFEVTNVASGRTTWGHRFLGSSAELHEAEEYKTTLLSQHVIADPEERKMAIKQQIEEIAANENWNIPVNEGLLEEVNNLVEYPTALYGSFDESFLDVPEEVLVTSMREHQRYFPVMNQEKKLLPYFITVRNGDHRHLENVQKGNEKVLRARLADAEFFFKEDKKQSLEERLPKLKTIVYHEELGSIADKVERIKTFTELLSSKTAASEKVKQSALRAAKLSKADLVTHMVDEFPELEGRMGEYYALHDGEDKETSEAIREHYLPKQAGDTPPQSASGSLVSVADKLDTLVTSFGIGSIPTGSQDPHGLRRQTAAILQTYLVSGWNFNLFEVIEEAVDHISSLGLLKEDKKDVMSSLKEFFELRYKNLLKDRGIRYDVAEAVMESGFSYPGEVVEKSSFLMNQLSEASFKKEVEAFSRVTNIAQKLEGPFSDVKKELFEKAEEKDIYEAVAEAREETAVLLENEEIERAYETLKRLVPYIHNYFDNIMVMSDDKDIKANRLNQMKQASALIRSFADFQKIVFHS